MQEELNHDGTAFIGGFKCLCIPLENLAGCLFRPCSSPGYAANFCCKLNRRGLECGIGTGKKGTKEAVEP
jgi:hypothetical protein